MSENVTINLNEPKENITISLVDQGEEIIIKLNEQARGPSVVVDNAVVNAAIAEDPQATRDALEIPIDNFTATTAPTVNDDSTDGYAKGSRWYDSVGEEAYICVDASVGAAIWIKTTLTVDELGSAAFLDATTDGAANPEEVLKTDANGDVTVHNINVGSVLFDTANGTPDTLGELGWDSEDETLAFVMKSGEVLQIGEETLYHIENNTVSTIAKGTPVMYAGTIGNSGKLRGKPWDGTVPKAFLGIASAQILGNGGTGYVTHFGKVKGIQTNGANYGETWVSGDIIYAVSGSSNLTKVQPSAGGYVVVAVVIAAHASNGTLFVRPTEVPSLTDIGAAATLHTHGNITSDGRIGSTATLPIITTTGGTLTTGAFGTTAGTFAQGNDARLSDERVPTAAGIASKINGATAKTTLVDADETVLTDSEASFGLKKVTWANVFAYILTKIQAAASIVFTGQLRSSNQTASTGDALMTRDLSDTRYHKTAVLDAEVSFVSTTTLTDIPMTASKNPDGIAFLGFTVEANAQYSFSAILDCYEEANPRNQKFRLSFPTGTVYSICLQATGVGTTNTYHYGTVQSADLTNALSTGSFGGMVIIQAVIRTGANAGNIILRAAQTASSATGFTIRAGSSVSISRKA